MGNALTEIAWVKTTRGLRTVREVFLEEGVELSPQVPGYEYGAQFRFLMTVAAVVAREAARRGEKLSSKQSEEAIEAALALLAPAAELFSEDSPFLQVSVKQLPEGAKLNRISSASKLFPHNLSEEDNASVFWHYSSVQNELSLEEAVLGLVCFYFYAPGTNTSLLAGNELKLTNGSSALQYKDSVELLPQGEDLRESLFMATPKSFLEGEALPHWADREANSANQEHNLWKFSWSANVVHCLWRDNGLVGIIRGGEPSAWHASLPQEPSEGWPKRWHDLRRTSDPLYLYVKTAEGEQKLKRFRMSTDPYYTVARWHAEKNTQLLSQKWSKNIISAADENLQNIVFLEHNTEGASSSFAIRYSRVVLGYRDELFPKGNASLETISDRYQEVLRMRGKLRGILSEKGTCSHLSSRQDDLELAFWGEMQDYVTTILTDSTPLEEIQKEVTKRAERAFEQVSSTRNSIRLPAHYRALNIIAGTFRRKTP